MSIDRVHAFIAKVGADPELSDRAAYILTQVIDRPRLQLLALARDNGFEFTPEEGEAVLNEILKNDELPDTLLEIVSAGGTASGPTLPPKVT